MWQLRLHEMSRSLMKFSGQRKAESYSWHPVLFHGKNKLSGQVYLL